MHARRRGSIACATATELSKFCLRHGRRLPGVSWGVARRRWLAEQRFAFPARQRASYLHALGLVDHRIGALERAIAEAAEEEPWRECVGRLRCLRGVDTLTALSLVSEIGDFGRFSSAAQFMAFVPTFVIDPCGQDVIAVERAWRRQQRLHARWCRMAARGKPSQKIARTTARGGARPPTSLSIRPTSEGVTPLQTT